MANDKTDIENFPEEFTWSPYLKTITGQNELGKDTFMSFKSK